MEILKKNEEAFEKRYGKSLSAILFEQMPDSVLLYSSLSDLNDRISKMNIQIPQESKLLLISGFQDGLFIQRIRGVSGYREIFIAEEDKNAFLISCCKYDLSDIISDNRIRIWIEDISNEPMEAAIESMMQYHTMKSVFFVVYPEYEIDHKAFTDELWRISKKKLEYIETVAASRVEYSDDPCKNELYCISQLYENSTVDQLFETIPTRDIPVIMVSAGPSLSKNVSELGNAWNKALIVVMAHAAHVLENAKVKANFAAMTDPGLGFGFMDFDLRNNYRIIISGYGSADLQKKYNGRCVYFGMNSHTWPIKRLESKLRPNLNAGSVATDMLSLFYEAGFKTFILVGQDLAYDEQGFSHVGGERDVRVYDNETYEVESIDGKMIESRDDWVLFLDYFEQMIREHDDITLVDATEGGALIHGSLVMSLREAICKYCKISFPMQKWFDGIEKGADTEKKQILGIFDSQLIKCVEGRSKLKRIKECAQYILNHAYEGEGNKEKYIEMCKEYDSLYKDILFSEDTEMIRYYCHDDLQLYINDALKMEGEGNVDKRTRFEMSLFEKMYEKSIGLIEYMEELEGDVKKKYSIG